MFSFLLRRSIVTISTRVSSRIIVSLPSSNLPTSSLTWIRPYSISSIHHNPNPPNMKQMMDEMSKNPKAMALFQAIQKDPKILQAIQELMAILNRKGYIDMRNPMKPPSLAMLTDSEVRTKLLELMRLLSAAGIFNAKDGGNLMNSFSNVMGLLMPSSNKEKSNEQSKEKSSSPKYDFTYDATTKETDFNAKNHPDQRWSDKLKKLFK